MSPRQDGLSQGLSPKEMPWRALYGNRPASLQPHHADALEMAKETLERCQDRPLVYYFDQPISAAEIDAHSDAFASYLLAKGLGPGDRVVAQLQGMPQFVIALVGTWKAGGTFVPTNPMYRARELGFVLRDSGATAFLTMDELWPTVGREAAAGSDVTTVLTTSPLDLLGEEVPPALASVTRTASADAEDFLTVLGVHAGERPASVRTRADDPAALVYTSGTTGPPKGAMITHRNLVADTVLWPAWLDVAEDDVLMCIAPLFHITGLAANVGVALLTGSPVVLAHRFDAAETLRLIAKHRATFMVAAITAYTALLECPSFAASMVESLRVAVSGGAPIAPAMVERWRQVTGAYLQNCYGLTETTSLTHLVPTGLEAPVDPNHGGLSIGIPVSDTEVRIVDDAGAPLPSGEVGELEIWGPQVVPGYWEQPEETANAFPGGRLRTGDVGFMDEQGWFYLVDRRKDLIVASGFKVWPREVEDILVEHPAVIEAAVVGVKDEYRGETVKAFISVRAGSTTTDADLIEFCKTQMASYKYPRIVEIVDELPKTASGKILRRELRDAKG